MSVVEYGDFRFLLTLSMIYGIAFSGIPTALTKYFSQNKKQEYVDNSILLMGAIYIILVIIIFLFENNPILLSLFIFSFLVDSFYTGFSMGIFNIVKLSGFKLLENVIQLAILIIAYILYKQINFSFAIIFYCFSGILSLWLFELWNHELKFKFNFSKEVSKKIFKFSMPLLLGAVGWSILFGIDTIYVKMFLGSEYVGYLSVGFTIVQVFTFLPTAITTILLPKASTIKDKKRITKPLNLALIGTSVVSLILLIFLIFLKESIINIIFGQKYIISASVIIPLAIGLIFITLHQIYSAVFQGFDKPKIPSITILVSAIINIIIGYFLVQSHGIIGAAIANMVSCFVAFVMIIIYYHKMNKENKYL
jgi:O-antigen/teichoic acid export membrane protein